MCRLPSDTFGMIARVAVTVGVEVVSTVAVNVADGRKVEVTVGGSGVKVTVGGGGVLVAEGNSTMVGISGSGEQATADNAASTNPEIIKIDDRRTIGARSLLFFTLVASAGLNGNEQVSHGTDAHVTRIAVLGIQCKRAVRIAVVDTRQ